MLRPRRGWGAATDRPTDVERLDPEVLARAAEVQSVRAREFIDQIRDADRREKLKGELARLDAARGEPPAELNVVVFGTVSAGKTSLINALIGREVGETGAVMGTTRHGENHTHTLQGVDGTVHLTDTPGVSEAGAGGPRSRGKALAAGDPRRPAPVRRRPRPDPTRVRPAGRAGQAGQAVDRGPQQEGPIPRRRPGGDPRQAPRAARRRRRRRGRRGGRRRPSADPGADHAARRRIRHRLRGPGARHRRPSAIGSPPFWPDEGPLLRAAQPAGQDPAAHRRGANRASTASGSSGPKRWSTGTSG